MNASALADWTPLRLFWPQGEPQVDWCRLGAEPLLDPFFDQTVAQALRNPARMLFRRQTPAAVLEDVWEERMGLPPAGFIFHLSRCGSTLVAQMLAALADTVVVSEAPPIDQVLSAAARDPRITHAQRIAWFRGMVRALGQKRRRQDRRYFIKFDSWHTLELPVILEAFPDVPWIFIYRDPVEIMVSHHRQRGSQMLPGVLDPRRFGLDFATIAQFSLDEFCARVLAQIAAAAIAHAQVGQARLVNFTELPAVTWESLGSFFGLEWSEDDVARMRHAAKFNAKAPTTLHADDRAAKQREASEEIRHLAHTWLGGLYAQLEAARAASASSSSRSQSFTTQSITR